MNWWHTESKQNKFTPAIVDVNDKTPAEPVIKLLENGGMVRMISEARNRDGSPKFAGFASTVEGNPTIHEDDMFITATRQQITNSDKPEWKISIMTTNQEKKYLKNTPAKWAKSLLFGATDETRLTIPESSAQNVYNRMLQDASQRFTHRQAGKPPYLPTPRSSKSTEVIETKLYRQKPPEKPNLLKRTLKKITG